MNYFENYVSACQPAAAVWQVAFAYGGHNVVLEIQATLPHPPSTVKPMMKGVYVAYMVVLWCYFSVSVRALCSLTCEQLHSPGVK